MSNTIFGSGGGGGGDGGMDTATKEYVDAKADATRATNDARFAEVLFEIRALGSKLDATRDTLDTKITTIEMRMVGRVESLLQIVGVVATGIAIVLGVISFGGDRFAAGIDAAEIVERTDANRKTSEQRLSDRIDQLERADLGGPGATSTPLPLPAIGPRSDIPPRK